MATVTLRGSTESLSLKMLIDSGADISIISFVIGEYLGFHKMAGEPELNIYQGGRLVSCFIRQVETTIGDFNFQAPVAWAQIVDSTKVLGRYGVFKHFSIEFRESELKTIFR